MNLSKTLLRIQQPKMSLWYSTLSMGFFIDGDGNIILKMETYRRASEYSTQEQEGLNLANKLSSNHIQFQLLCCRCDWASCIFNKFSKGTYVFTTLKIMPLWIGSMSFVYTFKLNEKNVSFPRFTDRINVWKVMIRTVLTIEWKFNRLPP
jgi:hypothetical protein